MLCMVDSPLRLLQERLASDSTTAGAVATESLAKANGNASRNTYLALSQEWTLNEAESLSIRCANRDSRPSLFGAPVSLKDCFDLEGFRTSCGTKFYEELNGTAHTDSAIAARLRSQGAVIIGKTHLHPLAYGITGENPDFGDCVQPLNKLWLTGGSSSGAAASVQESSALVAIGTDTGGSIRVPAALCGLAGYRSSLGVGSWQGGAHLAPSFDTLGFIFEDLRDGPSFAHAIFGIDPDPTLIEQPNIGVVRPEFLHDCEPRVLKLYEDCRKGLDDLGAITQVFDTTFWDKALKIFAPIQAHEAAALHRGHFREFESSIASRLMWGESISAEEIVILRTRAAAFNQQMDILFQGLDFLIVPCAPVSELRVGADHSTARQIILRYTTPMSLAGLPVVTLPFSGGGVQLVAPRGRDAQLLAYSAHLEGKIVHRINA
jgi:Asp-tRNA(Asn)/Glu-tRNA(Gln) amidotransferase A subunit family amidase